MERMIRLVILCLLVFSMTVRSPAIAAETSAKDTKPCQKAGQDKEAKESKEAKAEKKPSALESSTHTVKQEPLVISVTLDGVFEAGAMHEIAMKAKQWSSFKVLEVAKHGQHVKRGDLLVSFETEEIDRAIADRRAELKLSQLAIQLGEQTLRSLEETTPLDVEASRRERQMAQEDFERYEKVDRPMALKSAAFMLKAAQQSFEYQQEEVRQLEKMYKADDLTEETEEIVLRRARNSLERDKFSLEQANTHYEEAMKLDIPRGDKRIEDATKRARLQWDRNKVSLQLELKKAELELKKLKVDCDRAEEKLDELLADRATLTVKAPADGIVYFGSFKDGKLSGGSSLAESLRPGGNVAPDTIFMTIVGPRPMFIRASVPEEQLHCIRPGIKGAAQPTGYPDMQLPTTVKQVDAIPASSGCFGASFAVALSAKAEPLTPGMTCKVKFITYRKRHALTIPPKALSTDTLDDQQHYVYMVTKQGETKKRKVTVGKRTDKQVEILEGLSKGDQILSEPPKDQ